MSKSGAINGSEGFSRRYIVDLKTPRPWLWETDETSAFIENLHQAEDLRLERNPLLCKEAGFAQEQDRWDILCLPKPKNKIRTAHSLGDEDTTVFISEFGELVSFSKYLGLGIHGTVLVGPPIAFEWDRDEEFNDILDGMLPGVGLRLEDRKLCSEQSVDYVHDRWPRVSYKTGDLDIKVQFVVHEGVVAQQYLVKNLSQEPQTCVFNLDLGFGTQPSPIDDPSETYQPPFWDRHIFATAGGYAAMLWAGDGRRQVQLDVVLFQDGRSVKLSLSNHTAEVAKRAGDQTFSLLEDVAESTTSPRYLHTVTINPDVTKELTAVYYLERHRLTKEQEQALEPGFNAEGDDRLEGRQATPVSRASEPPSIRSGIENDTTVPVEGLASDTVPTGPNDTIHDGSNKNEKAQEDSCRDYNGEEYSDGLEDGVNLDGLCDLRNEMPNKQFLSPGPQYIDVSKFLKNCHRGRWTMSSTPTNQLLRRHLQQVLSVNSLSIPRKNGLRSGIVLSEAHVIYDSVPIWGSLCMFRFLLCMYIFLDRPNVVEGRLRDHLKSQIKDTCERHLDWTFDIAQPLKRGWARTYYLNGSYSKSRNSDWYYGAVQFIKLYEFRMVFQAPDDQLFVLRKLQKRLGPWFESLEEIRNSKSNLWVSHSSEVNVVWLDPEYRQDEIVHIPQYIVTDLIILWKAKSFIFELLDESINPEIKYQVNLVRASLPSNWRTTFSPSRLKTKIMDYFTYEYLPDQRVPAGHTMGAAAQVGKSQSDKITLEDTTKKVKELLAMSVRDRKESDRVRRKRVLAFRWAGNDKPRYLWQSWASPIFEAVNHGFFKSESSMRVWKDTLEVQRVHQEHSWMKLAKYALALRAAQHGQSLDITLDPEQMRKRVCERLLECCYSNGTFPTEIDLTTKQPTSKWWEPIHSTGLSEILLLLLQEESKCSDIVQFLANTGDRSDLLSSNNTVLHRGAFIRNVSGNRDTQDTNKPEEELDFDPEAVAKERSRLAKSARQSARSTKIDRANVRDPPEFEPDWLFPYPDCFASDEPTGGVDEMTHIHEQAKRKIKQLRLYSDYWENPAYRVLEPAIDEYLSHESHTEYDTFFGPILFRDTTVVDVGQTGRSKMSMVKIHVLNLAEFESHLFRKRTVKTAKKRLTIIHLCQPKQALLLYLGSAESEKPSAAGFLSRHKMRENFTRDHAHKEVNLWVTELHLSFYKIVNIIGEHSNPKSLLKGTIFEGPGESSVFPGEPRSSSKRLQKSAIGWRFSGDLHDRRWTGTVLAFVPDRAGDGEWITSEDFEIGERFHGQRTIIEARLFSNMIETINVSTREILRDLDTVLGEGEGGIYRGSMDHHDPFSESFDQSYSRSKLFLQLSDFLGHLDDSFEGIVDTIESYTDREKQRPVQPRWSIEDERQYRSEIRRWDQQGKRNVALLRSLRSQIITKRGRAQHLRESLNADMQLREARLQARTAEDVRLFTYVTIIFLPISFSASLFSMQQAPGNNVVGTFAKVAIVALITTLIVLFNLKTMNKNMWTIIHAGLHKTSYSMSISSWKFWKKTHKDLVQAEKRNIQSDEPIQIRRTSKWWYFFFLVIFVLLELPAIRVLLAYDVCFPPANPDSSQPTLLKKVIRVILGLLSIPLFAFIYAILFLLCNLIDLLYQLYSLPGVDMRSHIHGTQASTDPSKERLSLDFSHVGWDSLDSIKSAETAANEDAGWNEGSFRLEMQLARARQENFNARVARLTHPPRPLRSLATASDGVKEDAKKKKDDQISEEAEGDKRSLAEAEGSNAGVAGIDSPDISTGTHIGKFLDKIGWKGSPKKESRTARTLPV